MVSGYKTSTMVEKGVIEKLSKTHDCLRKISKDSGIVNNTTGRIMNRAIEKYYSLKEQGLPEEELAQRKDVLHPKYRRLSKGLIQEQIDDTIEKLSMTCDNLIKIGKEVNLSPWCVSKIMRQAIQKYISLKNEGLSEEELSQRKDVLNPKYKRTNSSFKVDLVSDLVTDKLSTTHDSLTKIGKNVELCIESIKKIMNRAIQRYISLKEQGLSDEELAQRKDVLDPKYRRLLGGIIQEQADIVLEQLSTTHDNLTKIGKNVGLSGSAIYNMMNRAIKKYISLKEQGLSEEELAQRKDVLNPKYRRTQSGVKEQAELVSDLVIDKLSATHDSLTKIGKDTGPSMVTIGKIMKQAIKEGKLDPKYRRLPGGTTQEQVDIVLYKLSTSYDGFTKIGNEVGLSGESVSRIMKRVIQRYISLKEQGLSDEELAQRKDVLHPKSRRPFRKFESSQDFANFIKTDERLMEAIGAILSSFGENGHESKEYVFNHIVSRMIPGSVKFSLWSLGPYLGDITVGGSNLPAEEYIRKIPPEFHDHDPRMEHEFYKLLEMQVIRGFYENPEKTVSEIKQKADNEQNEFVKGLWCKLYDNLNGILNYDLIRNVNPRIPNPEYKGGKNYGKI